MGDIDAGIPPPKFTSLRDLFVKQAHSHGTRRAVNWVDETGRVQWSLTYQSLEALTFSIALFLKNHGLEAGDRVALLFASSLDFVVAFLACQILRAVPVPVPYATSRNVTDELPSIIAILNDVKPALTIVHPIVGGLLQEASSGDPLVAVMMKELGDKNRLGTCVLNVFDPSLSGTPLEDELWDGVEGEGLAYIQYSAGDEERPRGIMVSQANIMHQLSLISTHMQAGKDASFSQARVCGVVAGGVDQSFVLSFLWTLYEGGEAFLAPPNAVSLHPFFWMIIMSKYKIHISVASYSIYARTLRSWNATSPDKRPTLATNDSDGSWNLSSCNQLLCLGGFGQAPVLREFFDVFKSAGLRKSLFRVAYGALEHTGVITISDTSEDPLLTHRGRLPVGTPHHGVTVKIVDPTTLEELPEGFEGEIWANGPSKACGYWNTDIKDAEAKLLAKVTGKPDGQGYLRTGDLGTQKEGQIFVSGRLNDVISIRGRSHFATDIENVMEGYRGVAKTMAVGIPSSGADSVSLLYLVELDARYAKDISDAEKQDYCTAVARRIVLLSGIHVSSVILMTTGAMPRTKDGDPARAIARLHIQAGDLSGVLFKWDAPTLSAAKRNSMILQDAAQSSPITPKVPVSLNQPISDATNKNLRLVKKQWEAALQTALVNTDDFYTLGGTPVHAIRLTEAIRTNLKCPSIGIQHLIENPTLGEYATRVTEFLDGANDDQFYTISKKRWLWHQVSFPESFYDTLPDTRVPSTTDDLAQNVFIVGATTPLGIFLIAELLDTHKTPSIYCLSRAKTTKAGHEELAELLRKYGIWKPHWAGRLVPVLGDPTQERFGLAQYPFYAMADDIKAVIHCAAGEAFFDAYGAAEATNVSATKEAIRLALSKRRGKPTSLHLVSSLAVFGTRNVDSQGTYVDGFRIDPRYYYDLREAKESEVTHPPTHTHMPGYAQSLWVAEQLVQSAARQCDLPASIYRVGFLLGHSTTGVAFQTESIVGLCGRNFAKLRAVPKLMAALEYPFVTVDFAARSIAASASAPCHHGQVGFYHVVNGQQYPGQRLLEIFEALNGQPLEVMDNEEWWTLLDNSLPNTVLLEPPSSPTTLLPTPDISHDFVLTIAAFVPREQNEQDRVVRWSGRSISTVQLQDRLRELSITSSPDQQHVYESLSQELTGPNFETIDRALAVSLKWATQESKKQKRMSIMRANSILVTKPSPELETSQAGSGEETQRVEVAQVAVAPQRMQAGLVQWVMRTPALSFVSLLLWILLGSD
ncbi:hypothetical protein FRB99_007848 [Tulasnella sp. 403]|nr:hypothetical protein FRB99_007848 [Tulasnella sp. 403]